jgi:hypothetical protein
MATRPCIVVVSDETDPLSTEFATTLRGQGTDMIHVHAGALAGLKVSLQNESFFVNAHLVRGILFRASLDSTFSETFSAEDRSFCDTEVMATWLAALNLDSILAVNRYDAAEWFEGARWPAWRRRLVEADIPVSPFAFGDTPVDASWSWYPYTSTRASRAPGIASRRVLGSAVTQSMQKQVSLAVCNVVIAGEASPTVLDTAKLLDDTGVRIAEIATDHDGRVLLVNTEPQIMETKILEHAKHLLIGAYNEDMHRW